MHTFCFPQYCCCLVVAEIMACARDPNSRDRDVGQVGRDETETRPWVGLETVSRPRRRDRDHIPAENNDFTRRGASTITVET